MMRPFPEIVPIDHGLTYVNALADVPPGTGAVYSPCGPDGYPSIDQVTGKVFQAEFNASTIFPNIGTPDASGNPTFLDAPNAANPSGDLTKLITVATNVPADAKDSAYFVVTSMDSARNLHVAWVGRSKTPSLQGASSAWLERLDDIQ